MLLLPKIGTRFPELSHRRASWSWREVGGLRMASKGISSMMRLANSEIG